VLIPMLVACGGGDDQPDVATDAAAQGAFDLASASDGSQTQSGTFAKGELFTLTGSGFGAHATNNDIGDTWSGSTFLNFRFKDFEDNSLTSHGFYPQSESSPWTTSTKELGTIAGGPKNSAYYLTRTEVTGEVGGVSCDTKTTSNQAYVTFKFMMPMNVQSGKFFRMYADDPQTSVWLSSGCMNFQIRGDTDCTGTGCDVNNTQYGAGPSMTPGSWHRVEIFADGDAGNFTTWVDGALAFTENNWLYKTLGLNGHTMDFPNMIDDDTRGCGTAGSYNYDDIFIDFTQARVELGDAATWSAVKNKEIQIPVAWSDSTITFRANPGAFASGTTAYLYVIDSKGDVVGQPTIVTVN
jgi:hypothetical protein